MTKIKEFVEWLIEYAEQPLDPAFVEKAERKHLSTQTLLELGHGEALLAITGKLKEIFLAGEEKTWPPPGAM